MAVTCPERSPLQMSAFALLALFRGSTSRQRRRTNLGGSNEAYNGRKSVFFAHSR
jgi:hypothetical protein